MAQMVAALRQEFSELKKKQIFIDQTTNIAKDKAKPLSFVPEPTSPTFKNNSNNDHYDQVEVQEGLGLGFANQSF